MTLLRKIRSFLLRINTTENELNNKTHARGFA